MAQDHFNRRAPYVPRIGYLVPITSLALSLPTLIGAIALGDVGLYHGLTGQTLDVSAPSSLQSPVTFAVVVCYFIFGPVIGGILCLTQRARAEQVYGSVLLLGFFMKRLNTLALYAAGLALGVLMLLFVVGLALRGGT